jgi:phage terminase large subunit-like protein
MAPRLKSVAEIIRLGNPGHLTKAELARRSALEATGVRKAAKSHDAPTPAALAILAVPSATVEVEHIAAAAVCQQYALDVVSGRILAGKWVIAACQRYLDMRAATDAAWYFSAEKAQRVVDYLGRLGLKLLSWQVFCITNLFGFLRREDDLRLFRTATIFCATKQGKTTLLAGLGLYMADADGEQAPEVYVAATSKSQSKDLCFRAALMQRQKNEELCSRSEAWKSCIMWPATFGKFEPLASNSERLNGRNIHLGILDELSDMPTPDLYEVFTSSTVGRKQPLLITISTVGRTRESVAGYEYGHAEQVLQKLIPDDGLFCYLATLDDNDDPFDERVWIKSNPSLGVLVNVSALRAAAAKARATPSLKHSFLRYHANQWSSATSSSWIDVNDLTKPGCAYIRDDEKQFTPSERIKLAEQRLEGRSCIAGLDLALVNDLSVLALIFPPDNDNGIFEVLCRAYCPEDDIILRTKEHRVPYESWRDSGYLTSTPGNSTDYDFIKEDVAQLRKKFSIEELGFDIHLGSDLLRTLEKDGMTVVQTNQGFYLTPAILRMERLIKQHRLCFHGNPLIAWCISNVVLSYGVRQVRFDKLKSREKIDAAAAIAIAIDRFISRVPTEKSVYSTRGIIFLDSDFSQSPEPIPVRAPVPGDNNYGR